jgi:uncharacterized membrane protein YsdA (DUF1294 family)
MLGLLVLYLVAINAVTFVAFGADKRAAEAGRRRTPEATLLKLAAAGGAGGAAAAQAIFRHKTRKEPFRSRLALIGCAEAIALGLLLYLAR